MLRNLINDDFGAVLSAELIFILTILVIGLVVGLSELQHAIVSELDDVGEAIGKLNQSYFYTGFTSNKSGKDTSGGIKARTLGSTFIDSIDECDGDCDGSSDLGCDAPVEESDCSVTTIGGA